MKDVLCDYEQYVLRCLAFDLNVELPYVFLFHYAKSLLHKNEELQSKLVRLAWVLVNDSFLTDVCIRFKSTEIAASAIYIGR